MSDTQTDPPHADLPKQDFDALSPAVLADRVAILSTDGVGVSGGELPMWNRLASSSGRGPCARLVAWTVFAAAWCGVLALLAVALLRVFWHDGNVPLTWLNAFTLYIYVPAYAVLALSAWTRRWWLATASATVVAFHVAWVLPDFQPATPYVPPVAHPAAEPATLRIFYANVLGTNNEFDAMFAEAERANADVIVFAELHRPWARYMRTAELLHRYPYGTNPLKRHYGDINVFSRLPVTRQRVMYVAGRVPVSIDVSVGDQTVRLYLVHSPRPMVDSMTEYEEFWKQLSPLIAAKQGPTVLIGDFNATQHSKVYHDFVAGGLRSAHDDRGRGYATTWPNGLRPIPPIRIDQAMISPEVECVSISEGEGRGSDHKPLILELRIHSATPRAAGG